ncbi:bacteriophage P4 integrase [Pararhodospirillum oryzae]|uniref:Bacteriophage P4 integrase n=2 Tax=Pararhodospirillum oryzae TaxID=478448 RepID=A0A512H485_9PROT|nr:bacteriophage P4 integrase [Pararhodospirillum oryzae]
MPKPVKGLTARQVQTITAPGYHCDGAGLYLQVTARGGKSWVFRYQAGGRRRDMGLGSASTVPLAEARAKASEARALMGRGLDPLAQRHEPIISPPITPTFREAAGLFIEAKRAGWRNAKHAAQWVATLEAYAFPVAGQKPIDQVTTDDVLAILNPIWTTKPETASRVRGRVEAVLDYAKARGWCDGENPARWKGHLALTLPAKVKVRAVEGHASMPYRDLPGWWPRLQVADGLGARALELAILTAGRPGEVLGATWDEIDLENRTWEIPGTRMKAGAPHRVPLSGPALDLLRKLATVRRGSVVFPGAREGRPLSNMAMAMVLRRMGLGDEVTPHGFRSTFRTWAAECTPFSHEVCEAALAHTVGSKVVAAYQRGDLFEKRRALMGEWAGFVMGGRHDG